MTFDTIILQKEKGICTIVLNRPEVLNALNSKMVDELLKAIDEINRDDSTKVLVLTGAGRGFCAGADLREIQWTPEVMPVRLNLLHSQQIFTGIVNMEKPVIAAVNGVAVGAGCNIALACDIVIASKEAKFSQIFIRVGLVPDLGGMYLLPRLVGWHKAKELIFTGKMIGAEEAEQIGLINKAVSAQEFNSIVRDWAQQLANSPLRAIGLAKKILNSSVESNIAAVLEMEAYAQGACVETEDYREGVNAFLEKREPRFKGH
jgi:2-(1,2-epoxy-1,2-dihydrophenyl)acetyl-CoA isomerase